MTSDQLILNILMELQMCYSIKKWGNTRRVDVNNPRNQFISPARSRYLFTTLAIESRFNFERALMEQRFTQSGDGLARAAGNKCWAKIGACEIKGGL
jgi:hypothetical protein